jgi:hypothetical protein
MTPEYFYNEKKIGDVSYVGLAKIQTVFDGARIIKDNWWVVHPDHGAAFYRSQTYDRSPLCNPDREIIERRLRPGCRVIFIQFAYIPELDVIEAEP